MRAEALLLGENYHENMDALQNLTPVFRKNGMVTAEDFPAATGTVQEAAGACCVRQIQRYREFMARRLQNAAWRSAGNGCGAIPDHRPDPRGPFRELELFERFDFRRRSGSARSCAHGAVLTTSQRVDRYGRMTVEAEVTKPKKELEPACAGTGNFQRLRQDVFPPCISVTAKLRKLQMSERPALHVTVGTAQHVCGGGELCGDSYACFQDGAGRQLAIVSDGWVPADGPQWTVQRWRPADGDAF